MQGLRAWALPGPPAGLSPNSTHGASPQGLRVSADLFSRPCCSLALGCLSSLVFVFLTLQQHIHPDATNYTGPGVV